MRTFSVIFIVFFILLSSIAYADRGADKKEKPKMFWTGIMVVEFPKEKELPPDIWLLPDQEPCGPPCFAQALQIVPIRVGKNQWKAVVPKIWASFINPLYFDTEAKEIRAEINLRPEYDAVMTLPVSYMISSITGQPAIISYKSMHGIVYKVIITHAIECKGKDCDKLIEKAQ